MYLKKIAINNIGPISDLFIELPFNENGTPKPLLLVGENGSGKTVFHSQVIDSFYEISSTLFQDIGIQDGEFRSYYKVSGSVNLKTGATKGFSYLSFIYDNSNLIEYIDKMGKVSKNDITSIIKKDGVILALNNIDGNQKIITDFSAKDKKDKLQKEWINGVHIFQPAYRYEEPYWKNKIFVEEPRYEDKNKYANRLNKEIEIVSSTRENKSFLLDLVLDFEVLKSAIDIVTWLNINNVLRAIKKQENIRFGVGPRGSYRVSIGETNKNGEWQKTLLPSIDNLSLGESILLNLFINIIRHGDTPPKKLEDIKGIVAIDEIDVHLHTDLQHDVLPSLIKLFPKVQFILTTHSPLFILGMEKEFGENKFEIRNMPIGEIITSERFSEFNNAYEVLRNSEKFEEDIKKEIKRINKPILYVEDEYSQIYKIAYLKLNDIKCNQDDFEQLFNEKSFFTINTGKSAGGVAGLLRVKDISIFEDKKIVGLFDFDKEGRENFHHLAKDSFWEKEAQGSLENGFYKKRNDHNYIHALLLPIPSRLKNLVSLEWDNFISYVEIENLLSLEFLQANNFVEEKKAPGSIKYYQCKKSVKNRLWKKLFSLQKSDFNDFKNIFTSIEEFWKDES